MSRANGGALSADAVAVLAGCTVHGTTVKLPPGQLARPLYVEVNEVLSRLGGKWKGGKVAAHVFGELDPAPLLDEIRATGEMPKKNPTAFFPTPAHLAKRMVEIAGGAELNEEHVRILEPSAGLGAIAFSVTGLASAAQLDLVEILPKHVRALRELGYEDCRSRIHEADFLTWQPDGYRFDAVLMNPPFAVEDDPLTYIAHIEHAYSMLAPAGFRFRTDKRTEAFRARVLRCGEFEELPDDTFAESGTNVNTVLLTMRAA